MSKLNQNIRYFLCVLVSLCLTYGATAGEGKHIPVTTSSDAAMMDFIAGRAAMDRGDGSEANVLFRAAVAKDPKFAAAWNNLANTAFSTQEFAEALKKAAAVADHASDGERLMIDINQRFLDNDFDNQLASARELADKYPESARAWTILAGTQAGLNKFEEQRASLKKAMTVNEYYTPAYAAMGASYIFNEPKDFDKAEKYCRKAIKLQPGEDNYYWALGDVFRAKKNLDAARDQYTLSVQLDPHNGTAFTKRGHTNSFLGNYTEARADYDQAGLVAPAVNKSFLSNYKAFVAIYENNPERAVRELMQIADNVDKLGLDERQRDGARGFAMTNAATIAMHVGLHDQAQRILDKRAKQLRETAEFVGTKEFKAIQEANIVYMQGQLAARRGDMREATKLANKNRELVEPQDNPRKQENYHALMGLIDLLQERFDSSVGHYRQANLNNIYVKHHLALAMAGAGQRQEARQMFKEVADWNFNSVGYALIRKEAKTRSS